MSLMVSSRSTTFSTSTLCKTRPRKSTIQPPRCSTSFC